MPNYYMEHEKELQDFVNREVIYCVSELVSEINQNGESLSGNYEELSALYQGPPSFGDYTCPNCDHEWEGEPDQEDCLNCSFNGLDDDNFEPTEYSEVLEHWIVTTWLANRLQEKGEAVCHDFYGLTVWGRTTSGQGIALDSVISEIHQELHTNA